MNSVDDDDADDSSNDDRKCTERDVFDLIT